MNRKLRTALIVILSVILALCVAGMIVKGVESWQRQQAIQDAQNMADPQSTATETDPGPIPTETDPEPVPTQSDPEPTATETDPEPTPTESDPEPSVTESAPGDTGVTDLKDMTLEQLQAVNPDVVGWIRIPGTPIDYPMVQGADNEYYLDHTWQKKYNSGGAIFMECQNSRDFSDFNTIIYGHRMTDSSMFNSLRHYDSQSYWEKNPTVYIVTEDGVRTYRIFSACRVHITDPVYWLITNQNSFKKSMIQFCLDNSEIRADVVPTAEDRLITLSTCVSMGSSDYRWVVVAMLTGYDPAS